MADSYIYTTLYVNFANDGINNLGQIVGHTTLTGGGPISFLYSNGTWTTLNDPSGTNTSAYGINNLGEIVGSYTDSSGITHGFLYSNGTWTTLNDPSGTNTSAYGINNLGQIVGSYTDSSGITHGFLYSNGTWTTLNDPFGTNTSAYGINNSGQIVGYYYSNIGYYQGFLYSNGTWTTLTDPSAGQPRTQALGINDAGQIVGYYYSANGDGSFLYSNGTWTTLNDPPYNGTWANGINDLDQIVGTLSTGSSIPYGFLANPGSLTGTWNQIDDGTPTVMVGGDFEGLGSAQLAVSETGGGTYIYVPSINSWTKIDGGVATLMTTDSFNVYENPGAGRTALAAYFRGAGTYIWLGQPAPGGGMVGWTKIDSGVASILTSLPIYSGSSPEIAATFGGFGTFTWSHDFGWQNINGASDTSTPTAMVAGDFRGLGNAQLAGSFPGYGLYIWTNNGGWANLNAAGDHSAPMQLAAGNFYGTANNNSNNTDLVAYFPGYGTYIWAIHTGYTKIDSGVAAGYASVDLNGNGQNELLAYFPGSGVYEWSYSGGWSKYDVTSTLPTSAQQALFATGNFQGGSVVDAAVGFTGQSGIWLDPPSSASAPAPVTVGNGATVDLNAPSAATVTFAGASGTLQLDQSTAFSGTIFGFGGQDQFDLTDIAFSANATLGYAANSSNSGGALNVSDGLHTANIALLGSYIASSFVTTSDGHGGTLISEAAQAPNPIASLAQPHATG